MAKKITLLATILLIIAGTFYAFIPPKVPSSPKGFSILGEEKVSENANANYRILGFLPHWNLKKITPNSLSTVTDLAYFALEMDGLGNIKKMENSREENPGWTNWKRFVSDPRFQNHKTTLTIQILDEQDIENLLNKESSRKNAINNILDQAISNNLSGVNLDFEPEGSVPTKTKDNFTIFIEELNRSISQKRLSGLAISIDVYPTLVGKQRLWDLARLAPLVDYIVIMGYDYHYRGSDTAGPVAPLRGEGEFFNDDLITNLKEISDILPSNKIVLGIPFYGYKWRTITGDKYSPTIGRGITAPLSDVDEYLEDKTSTLHWDRNSLTPYLIVKDNAGIAQIYFENALSLGFKLDLVKSSSYQGIAIWALGYENDNSPLWHTIEQKLN